MKKQTRWTTLIVVLTLLVLACASCGSSDPLETTETAIPSVDAEGEETAETATQEVVETTPTAISGVQPTATNGQEPAASTEIPVVVEEAPSQNINTAFILDASGSMLAVLSGRTRLAIAQDAIGNLSAGLPASINASLWVYGHRVEDDNKAESCRDIEQVIELRPVDSQEFDTVAHSFEAKGYTPITDALLQAASSLPVGPKERNTIVLLSDGEETCGGDPCALAAELAAGDIKLVIHTIGLAVDDITRAQLECIADVSGGTYTDADSAEDLSVALEEAAEAASNGTFSIVEGLGRPSVVVVSPDGRNVYVTGAGSESVVVFSREPDSGRLTFIEMHVNGVDGVLGIDTPEGLAISPDGKHVYATGGDDLALAIFGRNPDTGALTFVEAVDVFGSVASVDSAHAVAVSPDNRNVYAANIWHTMAVFNRDPGTGALTFAQLLEDDVDVVNNGLLGVQVVVVSPDNQHVYVTSRRSDAVTIFDRNLDTGTLTFLDQLRGKIGNTTANLDGAHGLAVSPDGQHVYIASDNADMLLSLSRDPQAGTLAFIEEFSDNVGGVDGLENGWSVAVSPDGHNVYVAGFDDDSLSVFTRDISSGSLAFIEVIRNKVGQ